MKYINNNVDLHASEFLTKLTVIYELLYY